MQKGVLRSLLTLGTFEICFFFCFFFSCLGKTGIYMSSIRFTLFLLDKKMYVCDIFTEYKKTLRCVTTKKNDCIECMKKKLKKQLKRMYEKNLQNKKKSTEKIL